MQKMLMNFVLTVVCLGSLVACTNSNYTMPWESRANAPGASASTGPVTTGGQVGGTAALAMDSLDRSKLSHALDNPLGKATSWTNQQTGTTYTVTPTEKVVLNENPYCRRYTVSAVRGAQSRQTQGTACVGSDSNWQAVRG